MYVELLKWHNVLGRDNKSTLMGVEHYYYKTLLHETLKIGKAIFVFLITMIFEVTEMKIQRILPLPTPPPSRCQICVLASYFPIVMIRDHVLWSSLTEDRSSV